MRIKIDWLGEPDLLFGRDVRGWEPKRSLAKAGRLSAKPETETIRLGLVALPDEVEPVRAWFDRMQDLIVSSETNVRRFPEFPGLRRTFNAAYELPDSFVRCVDLGAYRLQMARPDRDRFESILDLFAGRVEALFGDV